LKARTDYNDNPATTIYSGAPGIILGMVELQTVALNSRIG